DLPNVFGDRIQLQQVILNLIRNATEAMADTAYRQRELLIKTERQDGGHVTLTVRDNGVGLPPEGPGPLFDAFKTSKNGGMGIGLFVSKSIIEKHRGRIWGEPNQGGPGAAFAFSIPSAEEMASDGQSSTTSNEPPRLPREPYENAAASERRLDRQEATTTI